MILALDLGTKLGWAAGTPGNLTLYGTKVLAKREEITAFRRQRMDRRLDPRAERFLDWLIVRGLTDQIQWIFFEDVQFSSSTQQTQLWSSFRGVLWGYAHERSILVECCPTGTLKLFATGHGAATKEMMAKAWVRKNPEFALTPKGLVTDRKNSEILDDNAVDALHLFSWASKVLQNLKP